MSKRKNQSRVAYICIVLILVLVMIFSGLQILESTVFSKGNESETVVESKTITVDGVDYFPRQDITVMMVLGIDQDGPVCDSGSYRNPGAADMAMLLVIDEKNEEARILYLNRDTMMDIPILGVDGLPAGTLSGQLALAHTYGSGLEDSAENTRKAISSFLHGVRIDYYVSMNMDAIGILNDALGGVTVTVVDDFSAVDPSIKMGEFTLRGAQAETFVRSRKNVGDQLNVSRIERQKEYVASFMTIMRDKVQTDDSFILSAYDDVSPYIVTDCSANTMSGFMDRYAEYPIAEIVSVPGENVRGEQYMEYHVDEDALDELVLRLFYAPK